MVTTPKPRLHKPYARLTHRVKAEFLRVLAEDGNASEACRQVGCSRVAVYDQRRNNPDFAVAWEEAEAVAAEGLEHEAHRRGVEGWREAVWYQGQEVGTIVRYSDRLLELLLKAHHPKFRDVNRVELSGPDGNPLQVTIAQSFGVIVEGSVVSDSKELTAEVAPTYLSE